jgi:hypothetical protein
MYTFSKTRRQLMREAQRGLSIGPIELEREKKKKREKERKRKKKAEHNQAHPLAHSSLRGRKRRE